MEPARSLIIPLPSVNTSPVVAEMPVIKKAGGKSLPYLPLMKSGLSHLMKLFIAVRK